MNESTKKLMLQMAKVCEEYYYRSCVFQAALHSYGQFGWRERVNSMLEDSSFRAKADEIFQPLYTKIQAAQEVEQEIEELLQNLPKAGPMN